MTLSPTCLALLISVIPSFGWAQGSVPSPADTVISWRQLSRWTPTGVDSMVAPLADSVVTIRSPELSAPGFPADWAIGDGLGPRYRLLLSANPYDFTVGDTLGLSRDLSVVTYEAIAALRPLELLSGSYEDSLVLVHVNPPAEWLGEPVPEDTTTFVRSRRGSVVGEVFRGGTSWLRIRALGRDSMLLQRVIDRNFEPTRMVQILVGPVAEEFLYDSATGRIDSLVQRAQFQRMLIYWRPGGREETVVGRWDVVREASRIVDPSVEITRQFEYFAIHGRYPPGDSAAQPSRPPTIPALAIVDSLEACRRNSRAMQTRFTCEARILSFRYPDEESADFTRRAFSTLETGDGPWFTQVVQLARYEHIAIDPVIARGLIRVLGTMAQQRTFSLDRQEVFASVLPLIGEADSVTASAGDLFAAAARAADDPAVRNLFILGAYRGRPGRYLELVEQLADTTDGYGPMVRRYANGDPDLGWSWGMDQESLAMFPEEPMPPLEASWKDHRKHATSYSGYWHPQQLREWLAGHAPDGARRLRSRYQAETEVEGKLVWAQYLFQLDDLSPVPWVRSLGESADSTSQNLAIRVMHHWDEIFADIIRDERVLSEIQVILLRFAAGDTTLVEMDGQPVAPFAPHDERPGLNLLLIDNLTASSIVEVGRKGRLITITADSLQRRADRDGLVMALRIGPVTRIGPHYKASVFLVPRMPAGDMCLCGGGTFFTFVHQNGRWVVLSSANLVS